MGLQFGSFGAAAGMQRSLKRNEELKRKRSFLNKEHHAKQKTDVNLSFIESTKDEMDKIRDQIRHERYKQQRRRRIVFGVMSLIALTMAIIMCTQA